MGVLARRCDLKFVQSVMRKIGYEPSAVAGGNLKRVENIPWLRGKLEVLDQLDEAGQHSAVRMLMASSVKRSEAFRVIEHLLARGKTGGRRMAAQALAQFQGAEANALALKALDDEDPRVQAAVVAQLRARGIPGALSRLIDLVDSPHEVVRVAAAESLSEFDYDRFVAAFDLLDEEVRRSTGLLVRKINPHAVQGLRQEMKSQSRTRRLRAIMISSTMEAVTELQDSIIELLADEDHLVRAEAAKVLASCDSHAVREALRDALSDRSVIVQESAEQSLQKLAQAERKSTERMTAGTVSDEVRR
jgi:HEAT repeat protein